MTADRFVSFVKWYQLSPCLLTHAGLYVESGSGRADEPTEGIQPNIVHEIGDIILRLNKDEGLAVLLVEQKLPFARRVASEFCILSNGRRVVAGGIGELTDEVVRAHLSV